VCFQEWRAGAHRPDKFVAHTQRTLYGQADDITVIGGGIIPLDDIAALKEAGIKEIFQPGTYTEDIIRYIEENVKPKP